MQPRIFLLVTCVSLVLAGDHPDGTSKISRSQDALGNYQFGYTISNVEGEHFRQEGTDTFGRVVGSYGLSHADGRHRVVDYIADKDGFRARVRSNEPGVEEKDTLLERSDHGLDTAATSNNNDDVFEKYGKRLKPTSSRVTYVESVADGHPPPTRTVPRRPQKYSSEEVAASRDSRQRNLEGYPPPLEARPLPSPPNRISIARPVIYGPASRGPQSPAIESVYRPQSPAIESVYRPPIDPHTAVRRPTYYIPRQAEGDSYTTTSRRPFIPPYGGFENEPLSIDGYPAGVSMTNIHGGLGGGSNPYLAPETPTRIYGAGRYPSDPSPPVEQVYDPYAGRVALPPSGTPYQPLSPPPRDAPQLVLRAVPIPNGIQAVRVDPATGRVYDRLDYPLYLREEGVSPYDRNVLVHNDDVSDDADDRRREPGDNYDIPLRVSGGRPTLRDVRNRQQDGGYHRYNGTTADDETRLSRPSARDMELINRHLSIVNQNRYGPNREVGERSPYGPPPQFDDDEDQDVFRGAPREFNPYAGAVPDYYAFERPEFPLSRFPRNGNRNRRLSTEEAKEDAIISTLQATDSKSNGTIVKANEEVAETNKE